MEKFYIGIDIGDGETAVAVLTEHAVSPLMVALGYKNPSILSAFGFDKENKPVIGENVVLSDKMTGQTVRFKSRFLIDTSAGTDLLHFAQGLAKALQDYSGLMSDQDERRMIIGCPTGAGWTADRRTHYAGIIRQALPICEQPVGESRAAFLYTRYSGDTNIPQELLNENVLVIDMGSSTTDLAYIVKGKEQIGVFGAEHLGGGLLDRALLDECVAKSSKCSEIKALFERVPSARHRCEITARRIKEGYFTAQAKRNAEEASTVQSSEAVFQQRMYEILFYGKTRAEYTRLELTVDEAGMSNLLNMPLEELEGRSYMESLQELLEHAREVTKEQPPNLVIMTGGASKMPFVQQAVRTAFPNAVPACCNAPEHSIAQGLAFACRVDARMENFRREIDDFTKSPLYEKQLDEALPELVKALAEVLSPLFVEQLFSKDAQQVWHGASARKSQAMEHLHRRFFKDPKVQNALGTALERWGESGLNAMSEEICRICRHYRVRDAQLPLPKAGQLTIKLPAFELAPVIRMIGHIPLLGSLVRQQYVCSANSAMSQLLSDRAGTFYLSLRSELKDGLKADIDQRAREVEIPIV